MNPKGMVVASVVLLAAWSGPGPARGDLLYGTGFEAPTFQAGQSVDGQGGFAADSPSAFVVSTANPHAGAQDLQGIGSALPYVASNGLYQATAGVTLNRDVAGQVVTLESFMRLDGPSTAVSSGNVLDGDLVSFNLEATLGDGSYFSTYLSSAGLAIGYSTGYDASTPIAPGAYHDVALVLDFAARTATYLVDGASFGSVGFDPGVASAVLASVQFTFYAYPPPDADPTAYTAYADDLSVTAVPEPSSLALGVVGLGALAALRARRRGR